MIYYFMRIISRGFNIKFADSCSLIMVSASERLYFGLIKIGRIDSLVYLQYLLN